MPTILELARIGSLLFIFADSPNDQNGSSSSIDTFATRLSAQPLSCGRLEKQGRRCADGGVNVPDTEATTVARRVILLVDDDARFAKLTKTFLLKGEEGTNEVVVARDGVEAIEYLFHPERGPSEMPGLMLLDLNMPQMDGFGVLRKMRAAERTMFVPVVMLTSSVNPEDVRSAYCLGPTATSTSCLIGCPGMRWCRQWHATGWG